MNETEKPKPSRVIVPEYLNLSSGKKIRSYWDWYWKNHHKDHRPKIVIDFADEETE